MLFKQFPVQRIIVIIWLVLIVDIPRILKSVDGLFDIINVILFSS